MAKRLGIQTKLRLSEPGNQSLLRLQRKCSCGGTCRSCQDDLKLRMWRNPGGAGSADSQAMLRPRVPVGPVDDPFEHEADAAAERVMRMPEPSPASEAAGHSHARAESPGSPGLLPASAAIERKADSATDLDDDDGVMRRKAKPTEAGVAEPEPIEEQDGPTARELTHGGTALPESVRTFFETRFGRDFSGVRVHTGAESHRMNDAISSHAFTYGHHVWLGAGHSVGPSALLAHELAHVVQQTGPARSNVVRSRRNSANPGLRSDSAGAVRRRVTGFWYFEPYDRTGSDTHRIVLPALQRENTGLLEEVPSPISHDGTADFRPPGFADLYLPNPKATVGVWFKGHNDPKNLAPKSGVKRAPTYAEGSKTLRNLDAAPTDVGIADLKPLGEPAHKGVAQVEGYVNGLELVLREVNGPNTIKTQGTWNAKKGYAHPLAGDKPPQGLRIPPEYHVASSGAMQRVVLKTANMLGRASDRVGVRKVDIGNVQGRLVVQEDPQHEGIWNHFWVPNDLPVARFPRELQDLDDRTLQQVILPLTRVPVGMQEKRREGAIARDRSRMIRPKQKGAPTGISVRDPFNYEAWNNSLTAIRKDFNLAEKKPDVIAQAEAIEGTAEAVENLHKAGAGQKLQVPKEAKAIRRLEFWTGPAPGILGKFRKWFGGAFVAVGKVFLWGREKVRAFIRNHQKDHVGSIGGALGAVARVVFKVAKFAIVTMMPEIANRLWESLTTGVKQKLASLIPDNIVELYETKKVEIEGVIEKLQSIASLDVLGWLQPIVEPIETILKQVGEIAAKLRDVKEIISKIKWAMRLINCATAVEGNIAGCVASFFSPLADWLIKKIVERCDVQQTILPHLLQFKLIRNTAPNWIAGKLIHFGRSLLPAGWEGVLAEPYQGDFYTRKEDIPCEEQRTPVQRAMDEIALMFGDDEAKIYALAELMNVLGGDNLNNVKPEQLLEIAALVKLYDISTEQLQAWARDIANVPKDIPDEFRGTVDAMFRSIASGEKASTQFDTSLGGGGGEGAGEGSGGGVGTGKGSGGGAGEGEGAGAGKGGKGQSTGGPTQISVPGSRVTWSAGNPGRVQGATVEIAGGHSASDKVGAKVKLMLVGYWQEQSINTVVSNVDAEVAKVNQVRGKVMSIEYRILQGVTFDVKSTLAAEKKGQPLSCFRLCVSAGRIKRYEFEKPAASETKTIGPVKK
jgi:hypothetical protein